MKTFADAEQTLTGIYATFKSSSLFSGRLTLLPDIQADLVYAVEGNSNQFGNFWRWDVRPTDLDLEGVYADLYTVISRCNFFLERIDEVMRNEISDDNLEDLEEYTGEVYAIRALCYSELLKNYCKAYDPATAQSELGVVIRTKYSTPEPIRRASLYDSYKFVARRSGGGREASRQGGGRLQQRVHHLGGRSGAARPRGPLHAGLGYRHRIREHPDRRPRRTPSSWPTPKPNTTPTTPSSTTCGPTT